MFKKLIMKTSSDNCSIPYFLTNLDSEKPRNLGFSELFRFIFYSTTVFTTGFVKTLATAKQFHHNLSSFKHAAV